MHLETKNKEVMIEEIVQYADLYTSHRELEKMSFGEVKSIYESSMISFLKRINKTKSKSQ